jgi:hypothetical protein
MRANLSPERNSSMMLEATNQMTLETASFAEGAIEVMFL